MSEDNSLNNVLLYYKIINELQNKIGNFRSESIMELFKRYMKIRTPILSSEILEYQNCINQWRMIFSGEKEKIIGNINDNFFLIIEHIGSTSIPGQSSNNIIDIALIIRNEQLNLMRKKLNSLGYISYGNSPLGVKANWFWKIEEDKSLALVVHMDSEDNLWINDTLYFRDYLSNSEEELKHYNRHKKSISYLKKENILLYSIKKLEIMHDIISKAHKWKTKKNTR